MSDRSKYIKTDLVFKNVDVILLIKQYRWLVEHAAGDPVGEGLLCMFENLMDGYPNVFTDEMFEKAKEETKEEEKK